MKAAKVLKQRKYYKHAYVTFEPKSVGGNGTGGGMSWAVWGSTNGGNVSGQAYQACLPQTGQVYCYSKGGAPTWYFYFYNPNKMIVTGFQRYYAYGGRGSTETLYASNDGNNWTQLYSQYINPGLQEITFENNTPYNYYRLNSRTYGGGNADGGWWHDIRLFGQEWSIVETDASDYEFYKDINTILMINEDDTYKAFRSWEKGQYLGGNN